MMQLAGHQFGWEKALLVFASSEKALMNGFVSISHPYRQVFFFFFFLFPTIIDRKIVDSMIIYCTVWFPVVAKSTAKYLQEERLRRLKHRMKICFDGSRQEHQVCCCFV